MKPRSLHNSTKKKRLHDLFYHDVTVFHEVPLTLLCFPSRNITKNAETHLPPMHDVIIEQPQVKHQ